MPITEERSIVALLSDINSSLAAIKNQQTALQDVLAQAACHCDHGCRTGRTYHELVAYTSSNTAQGFSGCVNQEKISQPDEDPHLVGAENMVDLMAVPYETSTPMEQHMLGRFESQYEDVLESSSIQDSLSCLPPDDFRLAISATRGGFLRQLTSDVGRLSAPKVNSVKEVLRELTSFEDFRIKLGSGHFWVRDYDSQGCYTQWNCVDPPKVFPNNDQEKDSQCSIPDSQWPLNWSIQHQTTPIAPWRRIM